MRIGYCRVSKDDQNLALQLEALTRARCDRIVREKISGRSERRTVLEGLVAQLRSGDSLIVWRVDRLGRSFFPLVELEDRLTRRGVQIASLTEGVDTGTKHGRMAYWFLSIFAHQEHDGIITRTVAGLAAARAAGKRFGRKPKLTTAQLRKALEAIEAGSRPEQVAASLGVCRSTIYRHLATKRRGHPAP